MRRACSIVLLTGLSLALTACSSDKSANSETQSAINSETNVIETNTVKPLTLTWDDLMPEGEDEVLAELFTDYYEELEARMNAGAQTLAEASADQGGNGDSTFDVGAIAEGSANDTMEQIGTFNVVSALDGQKVRMPGYVVPLDFNAEHKYREFLLVPYFGACLHTPPPPPNQIVYIHADPAVSIPSINDPFWIEGTLSTGEFTSDLASTAYELTLSKIEPY